MSEKTMLHRATDIEEQLVHWRRDFHASPELSFQERRTATVIADELGRLGYSVRRVVNGTGVVADLGYGPPAIAVRADIDALPIEEANDTPYRSRTPSVMHACGHDAHAAILLGVGRLLAGEHLNGRVRLLFQPAEETKDENGVGGAEHMLQEGALDGIYAALALHVDSSSPVGRIKVKSGFLSPGTDLFRAVVCGVGGHGGYPHRAIDPSYIAAHVVLAVDGSVARGVAPGDRAVANACSVHAGTAPKVILDLAELLGTIRYQDDDMRQTLHSQIRGALEMSKALGADYDLQIQRGIPPIFNDRVLAELVKAVAAELVGDGCFKDPDWGMAGDDFAVFARQVPALMFSLGCALDGRLRSHHNPHFDIDERCLALGAAILAESALPFLGGD